MPWAWRRHSHFSSSGVTACSSIPGSMNGRAYWRCSWIFSLGLPQPDVRAGRSPPLTMIAMLLPGRTRTDPGLPRKKAGSRE